MEKSNFLQPAAVIAHPSGTGAIQQRHGIVAYLKSPKALLILAAGLGIIGLLAWRFGTAAVFPLLYTLPCAAMMAMCMRGHGGSDTGSAKPNSGTRSGPDMAQ